MKLSQLITEYVSFKQAIGMRFETEVGIFRLFLRTVGDQDLNGVAPSSVAAFISGKGPITAYWHLKHTVLSGLYRFAMSRGYADSSPLPTTVPKRPEPQRPHIYCTEELQQLVEATNTLDNRMSPPQAITFRTLLLTLYGTGLRIGEALALTIADVRIDDSLLVVRNSKFFKSRLVPVGPRLTAHLQTYLSQRRQLPRPDGEDSALFTTRTGRALSYGRVRDIFAKLRKQVGIQHGNSATCAPRLHDLRHTFAVHRLELWYREGADVQRLLPKLATYLGHVNVAQTQCYLTMTPELLHEASKRFENYALLEVKHG